MKQEARKEEPPSSYSDRPEVNSEFEQKQSHDHSASSTNLSALAFRSNNTSLWSVQDAPSAYRQMTLLGITDRKRKMGFAPAEERIRRLVALTGESELRVVPHWLFRGCSTHPHHIISAQPPSRQSPNEHPLNAVPMGGCLGGAPHTVDLE